MTVTAASGAVVSQIPRVWTKPNPPLGLYPGLYLNFTCPLIMGLHWTKDLNADVLPGPLQAQARFGSCRGGTGLCVGGQDGGQRRAPFSSSFVSTWISLCEGDGNLSVT